MFAAIGRFAYAFRFTIIGVLAVVILSTGAWGFLGLGKATKMTGLYDDGSASVAAAKLMDTANGRNANSDILVLVKAAKGKKVTDPAVASEVVTDVQKVADQYGPTAKNKSDQKLQAPVAFATPTICAA